MGLYLRLSLVGVIEFLTIKYKYIMKNFKTILFFLVSLASFAQKGDSTVGTLQNKTAWLMSSNFTIPTVQFVPYSASALKTKDGKGSVSFFNSIGAGISFSKADFTLLASKGDTNGVDIKNHVGFQLGFIFSKSTGQPNDVNRFALYSGFNVLDFQLGIGTELGDIGKDFKRAFYSISYSIPLSKFSKKTTLVLRNNGSGGRRKDLSIVKKAYAI
jgi:hypothetical protein